MRILIVDDEEFARSLLRNALERAGHDVVEARDGQEALDCVRTESFRMVISDWIMPRMDGLQLCRAIREADLPGYTYVILVTGRDRADDVVAGLSAGADDFIVKPFNPDELRVRVRTGERILSLETRDVAIFAMAKLAESRDPETGAHLERVRGYARAVAQQLLDRQRFTDSARTKPTDRVDPEYVRLIYLTSPLHDIGKVGVPDCVLLKPGRLNDREFEIMKTHTIIGGETLEAALLQYPSAGFLRMARDIALTHHERWDGTGYPNGLAGSDIPLCGRIVALADVYDALTTKRVYKPAFSHDVSRSMIVEEAGGQFDPQLVQTFLEVEERFLEVRACFEEREPVAV